MQIVNAHSCQIIALAVTKPIQKSADKKDLWINLSFSTNLIEWTRMDFKVILLTNQDLKTIFYEKITILFLAIIRGVYTIFETRGRFNLERR